MLLTAPLSGAPRRKNTLSQEGRRWKESPPKFSSLFNHKAFPRSTSDFKSSAYRRFFQYLLPAVRQVFSRISAFRIAFILIDRYFSAFTKRPQLSLTLRCLWPLPTPSPTVDSRWLWCFGQLLRGRSACLPWKGRGTACGGWVENTLIFTKTSSAGSIWPFHLNLIAIHNSEFIIYFERSRSK